MGEIFARAHAALRAAGTQSGAHIIISNPHAVLDRAGIPRTMLVALTDAGYCAPDDEPGIFRLTETIPRTPNVLFAIDVPNLVASCTEAGIPLDFSGLHERARAYGRIVFPLAFLDPRSTTESLQQELARAGFDVVSCRALATAAGDPKGIVDQKLDEVVRRHLAWSAIDTVIIASEDQNFLELVHGVRDLQRMCVVCAVNAACSLARAANEAIALVAGAEPARERRWNPEDVIDDLERLPTIPAAEHAPMVRRLELRAPIVIRMLRTMFLRRDRMPTRMPAFLTLFRHAQCCVTIDDRRHVSDDHLRAFLTALVNARIIVQHRDESKGADARTWYSFDDHHPLFRIAAERTIR